MRILVDTNIVLDFLLEREPFRQDAERLFEAIASDQITGYVTATTLTNIFYIARRLTQSIERARQSVAMTLTVMEVCPVDTVPGALRDRAILEIALTSSLSDFEDAVQIACAIARNLEAIVTRDQQDFSNSSLPVLTASQVLERLE